MLKTHGHASQRIIHLDLGHELRGGQRQVLYLAQAQTQDGWPVCIAAGSGAPILQRAQSWGIATLTLPSSWDYDPRNIWTLSRILGPGDILHTHDARGASLGALVHILKGNFVLLHTRRVSYALGQGWSSYKYARAQGVVCVSQEIQEVVTKDVQTQTWVIASAILVDSYAARQPGNGGRIGVIGALAKQKGHEFFLKALAQISPRPEVWIVGSGPLEDELHALARNLNLPEVVWKGFVESVEVLPLLDILVVPSIDGEGSSGVIKEAWAAQVPVLCSDLLGNLELVTHEQNGLVFANQDVQDFCTQFRRLQKDADLVHSLVLAGKKDVQAYDVSCMHAQYQQVYQALTNFIQG